MNVAHKRKELNGVRLQNKETVQIKSQKTL